jgi:hypothetical protein
MHPFPEFPILTLLREMYASLPDQIKLNLLRASGRRGLIGSHPQLLGTHSTFHRPGLWTQKPTLKRIFRSPLVGGVASLLPILAKQEAEI